MIGASDTYTYIYKAEMKRGQNQNIRIETQK